MSYRYTLKRLLSVLYPHAPEFVTQLRRQRRITEYGLLSVGLKLHCLDGGAQFDEVISLLGGRQQILEVNHYRRDVADSICFVLPPIGNAEAAILLLEALEVAGYSKIFNNPNIQIQVCSPGRLSSDNSALLTMGFCLGSDILRGFFPVDLETTFSDHQFSPRGRRIALYDAHGQFDRQFVWWGRGASGEWEPKELLPFTNGRTDILTATSKRDIRNVNLIATLLAHAEHGGFWQKLGNRFILDMWDMLDRHMLLHLVDAPWIRTLSHKSADDFQFDDALTSLMAYAFEDAERAKKSSETTLLAYLRRKPEQQVSSILHEMQALLSSYRTEIEDESSTL